MKSTASRTSLNDFSATYNSNETLKIRVLSRKKVATRPSSFISLSCSHVRMSMFLYQPTLLTRHTVHVPSSAYAAHTSECFSFISLRCSHVTLSMFLHQPTLLTRHTVHVPSSAFAAHTRCFKREINAG